MTTVDKKTKAEVQQLAKFHRNIEEVSSIINKYFEKHPELKGDVLETKFVIYNRICYPIIHVVSKFFYLGGNNLYFVLKSKCHIKSTGNVFYYEVIASEEDMDIGKSPIIPQGCPNDKNRVYPDDMGFLERRV
jgi:hypothetical protein